MAHYAYLDDNNMVIAVITGVDETELIENLDPETWYANFAGLKCKRTSYNGNYRKNYAGIGYKYDADLDAFIAPKPADAIGFDDTTCTWITLPGEPNVSST